MWATLRRHYDYYRLSWSTAFLEPEATQVPKEKQRQLFFLGMGMYGAIFFINIVFLVSYEKSSRIWGCSNPCSMITFVFTIADIFFVRSVCRKQFSANPELLTKWPLNLPEFQPGSTLFTRAELCISVFLLTSFDVSF